MALTLVQGSAAGAWGTANTGAGTGAVSVTWFGSRTVGSLLRLVVTSDSTITTPTGWTVDDSVVADAGHYLYFRISDNTATDAPTVNPGARTCIAWAEHTGNTASPTDVSTSQATGTGAGSISTGTTGSTAQTDEQAIACFGSSRSGAAATWAGHTNGFTEVASTTTSAGGVNIGLSVATKDLAATGTQECTATPSVSCSRHALIGTYKASASGAVKPYWQYAAQQVISV